MKKHRILSTKILSLVIATAMVIAAMLETVSAEDTGAPPDNQPLLTAPVTEDASRTGEQSATS